MRSNIDAADIQAIAKTAFDSLDGARYMLLRVSDPAAARRWLRGLSPTSVSDLAERKAEAYQVAVTAAGLRTLGIGEDILRDFSPEFVDGMAASDNRSRRL